MNVEKEYEYMKGNNKVCVKRKYKIKGIYELKKNELDEYFKNNAETIKSSKNLNGILADYNSKHENTISFSMLYQKYKAVFGTRKSQKKQPIEEDLITEHEEIPTDK